MNAVIGWLDKSSVGLSTVCAVHCLLMPVAVVMLPSLAALPFADERFHVLLVFLVLPLSTLALTMGCRKHRSRRVMAVGVVGLVLLVGAALGGHDLLGELIEKSATVIGAVLVALSHVMNFRECRAVDCHNLGT